MIRTTIHVHPSTDALDPQVREALGALVPVRFAACSNLQQCRDGDAVISLSQGDRVLEEFRGRRIRCFHVANQTGAMSGPEPRGRTVRFSQSGRIDKRLRGRSLAHKLITAPLALETKPGDEILASYGDTPVWVARTDGELSVELVSLPLPRLAQGEIPFDQLHRGRFLPLLPLLHFLREITNNSGWENPPLRACLMFDDPNLHWTSYGFLQYEQLRKRAEMDGFHVAFATVPLDAWVAYPAAARLFRNHPEQLSLLAHGNDHTKHELSQSRTENEYVQLAAQSLRRIDRMEKATGLHVARVMAPPHGHCSDASLAALLATGFEGVCASIGLLRKGNPQLLSSTFGLKLAEMGHATVPVIPRFRLDSSCENAIVISAFLDRPIIPVGHHHTAANGLELLASAAAIINSLGDVQWGSPEAMFRSNFRTLQEGARLWIEPYSSRIKLTVPSGVSEVGLHHEENSTAFPEFTITASGAGELQSPKILRDDSPLKVKPGDRLEFISPALGTVDYCAVKSPQLSLSMRAFPRRVFCEIRDRLMPLMPREMIPAAWTSG